MSLSLSSQEVVAIRSKIDHLDGLVTEFDAFYRVLGRVLPEINLEVYKTYKKASATLETLTSQYHPGKIDQMINAIAGHLGSAIHHVDHLQTQDKHIYRVLSEFSSEFEVMAREWEDPSDQDESAPLPTRFMDLRHLHASVLEPLSQIIVTEANLADDLKAYIATELKSLEETLTSITLILVDLINRSDATKQPILRIMTSLQLHDIISQDLATLRAALTEIERVTVTTETCQEDQAFIANALPLIDGLICQIGTVFAHETDKLRGEADLILKTISNEREDKILLSDFLLENQQGRSTFDTLLDEITDMLADVLSKLELLAARRWLLPGQLTSLLNLAEMLLMLIEKHAEQFAAKPIGIELTKKTLSEMIAIKSEIDFYRLEELKAFVAEMESTLTRTISELHEIRTMMLDSVAGIDNYSARCLSYLGEFQQTLAHDAELIEAFRAVSSMTIVAGIVETPHQDQVACVLRRELLERLQRPHLSSVLRNETDYEDGLTVF